MKQLLLLLLFGIILNQAKLAAQITITPTTLSCGNIEILNTTSGSHSFDVTVDPGVTGPVTIDAYDPGISYFSPSFEISLDGTSWYSTTTFSPNPAGETKTIYVRASPTIDQADHKSSDIYVYDAFFNFDNIVASVSIIYPEIDIRGNGVSIVNNDTTPSIIDATDIGSVSINTPQSVVFSIYNIKGGFPPTNRGKLFLKLVSATYVTISGTDASMFTLSVAPTSPINPAGGVSTFTIDFTPTSSGVKTATLTIYSNDADENPFTFAIQGTGASSIPTLASTTTVTSRTVNSGLSGGDISSNGGSPVTARGVCWSTSTLPTVDYSKTTDGTGIGTFSSTITGGLAAATHYYVRAYATNAIGTAYGPEVEFYTLSIEPTGQVTGVTNPVKTATTIDLSWTAAPGADGYIIIQKTGPTAPTSTGVEDGKPFADFTSIPVGSSVVFEVTSATCQITGLTSTTQYSFTIIPFAKGADNSTYNYKVDGTLGTITVSTTAAEPTIQASELKWETVATNSMGLSWTNGNGVGRVLVMKANSSTTDPTNGITYTGSTVFGSGDQIGAGTYVIYSGTGPAKSYIVISNLDLLTLYYFKVMEYNGSGLQTTYNMTGTPGFAIGNSDASALPITLTSFDASELNGNVLLKWVTASEKNNDYFIIERSLDGENFEPIGKIRGAGNSNVDISYDFTDQTHAGGVIYYRLKQFDFDGKETTFSTISININKDISLIETISLNDNLLNVDINSTSASMISLMDINGKSIEFAISKTEGSQQIKFSMVGLSRGIYFIRVEQEDGQVVSRKFIY